MKKEPQKPGPGLSTSASAFSELTKDIAKQNAVAHAAARKRRDIRDDAARAKRREWDKA